MPYEWLTAAEAGSRWPGMRFPGAGAARAAHRRPARRRRRRHRAAAAPPRSTAPPSGTTAGSPRSRPTGDGVLVRSAAGAAVRARTAVVAAGAWTGDVLGGLLPLPPLRVTQEQPAHFAPLDAGLRVAGVHRRPGPGRGLAERRLRAGQPRRGRQGRLPRHRPGVPPRRPRPSPPSRRSWPGCRSTCAGGCPGWTPSRRSRSRAPTPAPPTGEFVLDRVGPVVVAAGFSGHGFKSATGDRPGARRPGPGAPAGAEPSASPRTPSPADRAGAAPRPELGAAPGPVSCVRAAGQAGAASPRWSRSVVPA